MQECARGNHCGVIEVVHYQSCYLPTLTTTGWATRRFSPKIVKWFIYGHENWGLPHTIVGRKIKPTWGSFNLSPVLNEQEKKLNG